MFRSLAIAATALLALTGGGSAVSAAEPLPGPRQPIEHIAISGRLFTTTSGSSGCYVGSGFLLGAIPVPSPSTIIGATAYVDDPSSSGGIGVSLNRVDLTNGTTFDIAYGNVTGAPGYTAVELKPSAPVKLGPGQAITMSVGHQNGTCFKGGEVHFTRGAS